MSSNHLSDDIQKAEDDKDIRELGELANPILKYIYGIIQIHVIDRYRLNISKTFWYLLTLGLFSCVLLVTGNSIYVPLFFFILVGLDFIYLNGGSVKEKVWPEESKKIDEFFDKSNKKIYQMPCILLKLQN